MKLTKTSDFACRVLIYLAERSDPPSVSKLSETLQIPYDNLAKLIQRLGRAELVQTRQGRHGGVVLIKSPEQISLKTIIDVVEGPTRFADCLVDESACTFACGCRLKSVFNRVQTQVNQLLDDVTLDQIMAEPVHKEKVI